jgi:hypothetical protein
VGCMTTPRAQTLPGASPERKQRSSANDVADARAGVIALNSPFAPLRCSNTTSGNRRATPRRCRGPPWRGGKSTAPPRDLVTTCSVDDPSRAHQAGINCLATGSPPRNDCVMLLFKVGAGSMQAAKRETLDVRIKPDDRSLVWISQAGRDALALARLAILETRPTQQLHPGPCNFPGSCSPSVMRSYFAPA